MEAEVSALMSAADEALWKHVQGFLKQLTNSPLITNTLPLQPGLHHPPPCQLTQTHFSSSPTPQPTFTSDPRLLPLLTTITLPLPLLFSPNNKRLPFTIYPPLHNILPTHSPARLPHTTTRGAPSGPRREARPHHQ
jgi:hypothetical protein